MGRQLDGKVGGKIIARELILRKPRGKNLQAVVLDDKGEIISRPYQPSLAGLPRDVIDRFLTLKAFKGPRRNPQQLSFGEEKMSYAEKVDAMSPREFAVHLKNERRAMDLRKLEVTARIEARKQNE